MQKRDKSKTRNHLHMSKRAIAINYFITDSFKVSFYNLVVCHFHIREYYKNILWDSVKCSPSHLVFTQYHKYLITINILIQFLMHKR